MRGEKGGTDIGNRSHEGGRVITCCDETPALPISFSLDIDRADDNGATTNNLRARYAAPEGVGDKHRPNPATLMAAINGQLPDQQARDRIGRAASADATRGSAWIDSAWRKTIIADDLSVLVDHHDTGEILPLVGPRECPQPVIERGFAAFEAGEIMQIGKWFDYRERHDDSGRGCVSTEALERFRG